MKQLADAADVNLGVLRVYERVGLLRCPPRPPSGYREYPPEAVAVVRFIRSAQRLGFSLAEIAELLTLARGGPADSDECRQAVHAWLLRVEAKVAAARQLVDALRES